MLETRFGADGRQEPGLQRLLQTIAKYPSLTSAEESALLRRIRHGARDPLDRLINANLQRVVSIAGEFLGQGLGFMDLIAEGTLGLISAARHFDERRFRHFTRYAEGRIREQILMALADLAPQPRLEQSGG